MKFRRHHNNKGYRSIKTGSHRRRMKIAVSRLNRKLKTKIKLINYGK
ncbi:MAG: hypothetical protein [Podoviridae sp. ctviO18]|nr:MAG: hypothetical protein [Podoviridae sp. ctviO18]